MLFHRYIPHMKRRAVDLRQLSLVPPACLPISPLLLRNLLLQNKNFLRYESTICYDLLMLTGLS